MDHEEGTYCLIVAALTSTLRGGGKDLVWFFVFFLCLESGRMFVRGFIRVLALWRDN